MRIERTPEILWCDQALISLGRKWLMKDWWKSFLFPETSKGFVSTQNDSTTPMALSSMRSEEPRATERAKGLIPRFYIPCKQSKYVARI